MQYHYVWYNLYLTIAVTGPDLYRLLTFQMPNHMSLLLLSV